MLAFLDKIPFGTPGIRRILFWLITTFVSYVLIGFLIIPPVVKSVIADQATEALKRTTSVEKVFFNPLTFDIEVYNVQVSKLEGEGNLISIGTFTAQPSINSVVELAPVISHLHLRDLNIDITFFGNGKYSISDLIGSKRQEEKPEEEVTEEETEVFPFALYGFELTNATIIFDDRPRKKKHVISDLELLVPFTSSILEQRKEFTQPRFKAVVNGDPVDLKGRTLPFDQTLLTEFELGAVSVDLNQYWRYVPIESPLELVKGQFTSNISLFFERPDAQRISLFLGGGGTLTDLELSAPGDDTVLSLKQLKFEMERYSLGDNQLILTSVDFDNPYFKVIRRKDASINWAGYFPQPPAEEGGTEKALEKAVAMEATAMTKAPDQETATEGANGTALMLDIKTLSIDDGIIDWKDDFVQGGFRRTLKGFNFTANNILTENDKASTFNLKIGKNGFVSVDGTATVKPVACDGTIVVQGFKLPDFKAYYEKQLPMTLDSATLGAGANFVFKFTDGNPDISISEGSLTLDNLALRKPTSKNPSIGFDKLSVSGTTFDLAARNVEIGEVRVTNPKARVVRRKSGKIDLAEIFAADTKKTTSAPKQADPKNEELGWTAMIKAVRMTGGKAAYKDYAIASPASLSIDGLKVDLDNVTTRKGATMAFDISTRWGGRGSLGVKGDVILDTLKSKGRLWLKGMGLAPFDGHLGEFTELLFASGTATADLKYTFSGMKDPKYTVAGNAALHKVELKDNLGDGEFAGVDAFKLAGLRFTNAPYRLSIADIHLDGPHASISFDENGYLNIKRAFRIPSDPVEPEKPEQDESIEQAEAYVEKPKPEAEKPFFETVDIGKITMENGRVRFRDGSVQPVFYTDISDMKLGLIEISRSPDARPKMDFTAKIGPTPMSVTGVVNPVIKPMYSDLAIAVNGMELVPLTPYTVKNLAYPIEKGRLYADVTFKTDNWDLTAENKFFIEQLVLGPKDKRPDAPSVPVKFGLALLQDGNGDMELNLPIRGRLDDPDFRIGGIVFKAIASLFIKALASPFTLIGSIFGGSPDMDFVVFQPGRHELDQAGFKKMEATIKAMTERTKLKLEVDGVVDPLADKSGLVEVVFENKLKQQKFNSLSRKERAATTVDAMVVSPEEYEEILFLAYKEEPDPDDIKPTTLFMTDRQPLEYMEKFIIDRIEVGEDDLNRLAMQRAEAVKDHIIGTNPELTKRVFLLDRRKDKIGKTGVPQHRADLGIK